MNEFFKSIIGKCFLYTLLCVCIFGAILIVSMFIIGNTNIFEWETPWRFAVILFTFFAYAITIANIEIK